MLEVIEWGIFAMFSCEHYEKEVDFQEEEERTWAKEG